ncbi:hypothetical protein MTO96_035833, partial [Rhipicephalus appendiculatus]
RSTVAFTSSGCAGLESQSRVDFEQSAPRAILALHGRTTECSAYVKYSWTGPRRPVRTQRSTVASTPTARTTSQSRVDFEQGNSLSVFATARPKVPCPSSIFAVGLDRSVDPCDDLYEQVAEVEANRVDRLWQAVVCNNRLHE